MTVDMPIDEVLRHLPHRYPFLLVDRVLECIPGKSLVALKNVTINEPFFPGHFPHRPVMPAVLILEAMAQATGILALRTLDRLPSRDEMYYFVGVDNGAIPAPRRAGRSAHHRDRSHPHHAEHLEGGGSRQGRGEACGQRRSDGRVAGPGAMIHASAIVDPGARLEPDVEVGPFSIIGTDVVVGAGTRIGSHVVIEGPARIGEGNRIHSFSTLGGAPQDKKFRGESSILEIGNGNVIREYCTFNRGTEGGGMVTRVGDDNWIMAYVHIAHGLQGGQRQRHGQRHDPCRPRGSGRPSHLRRIHRRAPVLPSRHARILGHGHGDPEGRPTLRDGRGNSASPHGLNSVGLRRWGFAASTVQSLRSAYKVVYKRGLTLDAALEQLAGPASESAEVGRLREFMRSSKRGIVR